LTAAALLARAHAAGLIVVAEGDNLRLRGPLEPPADLLVELRAHKAEVLALLGEAVRTAAQIQLQPRPKPVDAPDGLQRAAMQRPPSWADPTARPSRGCYCSCCHGRRWWGDPRGWRCWTCHPPDHLPPDAVMEVGT